MVRSDVKNKTPEAGFGDNVDRAVYDGIRAVFADGAFCQKAITDALKTIKDKRQHPFVTSAFYGILDKNVRLDKIISDLCDKKPSREAELVLKIGLYYLGYADIPDYAAVNRAVNLGKHINGVFGGFINAVLKKSIGYKPKFKNKLEEFSYEHCAPEWLCKMLIVDYSETRAANILDAVLPEKTHIRPISSKLSFDEFRSLAGSCVTTEYGCYCSKREMERFPSGSVTAQSLASVKAVKVYKRGIERGKVLDLCAAPGGKSIYLSELGQFDITACDIYPHKIELMKKFAASAGARLKTALNDASKLNNKFVDTFDLVVADCPCSGTGTIKTKPDVMIKRQPSDINDLTALQKNILDCAAQYVKAGGVLCYSTCSILKCENEEARDRFLLHHKNYEFIDEEKFLPDTDKCDGFYIARFKRAE